VDGQNKAKLNTGFWHVCRQFVCSCIVLSSPAKHCYHKQLDKLKERQFKVKLTVINTPGYGDYVNNRSTARRATFGSNNG
jgi:hypothetical protein